MPSEPGFILRVTAPAGDAVLRPSTSQIGSDGYLTALVYEGDGFGAALVRGITTSLNLLERGRTRTDIFASGLSLFTMITRLFCQPT